MTLQPSPNPGAASATPEAVPRIVPAGDCALVVTFGEQIDREVSRRVVRLGERVMTEGGAGVIEAVPGMASLTVHFDPEACDEIALASRLRTLASDMKQAVAQRTGRRWTIPACYDGDLALDQAEVSARCDLAPEEIVRLHSGRDFHVYMLGFLPGFPYMGDLDAALRLPRRSNPRIEVPAGSIAIAGAMTAIYPAASPGGWHLIGRTPVLCVPGYQRNMSDFTEFSGLFHRMMGEDWPVVMVDLKGRGRSSDRIDKTRYVSTIDAHDLTQVCAALAIESAIFLGQGFGGQVVMALGALKPTLVAASVLIDAGPVSDPRGLVRLRNNLRDLDGPRSPAGLKSMFRRMLASDYPGVPEALLDTLATRTHYLDRRNRVQPLFDPHLIKMLEAFEHDDVLTAQWPLFNALSSMPMMMMRTQLTDQLRRDVFEEMMKRRRDADGYVIEGQASPALLNSVEDVEPVADFVRQLLKRRTRRNEERVSA